MMQLHHKKISMHRHHQILLLAVLAGLAAWGLLLSGPAHRDDMSHDAYEYGDATELSRGLLPRNHPVRVARRRSRHWHRMAAMAEDRRRAAVAAAAAASGRLPSYGAPDDDRPRVAHCLVGQRRTLDHPMIYQNYEAHVLSQLGVPSDVYVVLDAPTNATDLFHPIAEEYMPVHKVYYQYQRWIRCLDMMREHEESTGVTYSHVIFQRADQVVLQDLPSVDQFPLKSIWTKPYGEWMEEYSPEYSSGDDNATSPIELPFGLSDLFVVASRAVASEWIGHVQAMYARGQNAFQHCGGWGRRKPRFPEAALKCAACRIGAPVVLQHFQLRLLRPHQKGGCYYMGPNFGNYHYNSLCI